MIYRQTMRRSMEKEKSKSSKPELRNRAEEFIHRNPAVIKELPSRDIQKLVEELNIYQIELDQINKGYLIHFFLQK